MTQFFGAFCILQYRQRFFLRVVVRVDSVPYVEATILELLRYKTLGPLSVPHRTTKDTEVGGYFIPSGTTVCAMVISVLHGKLSSDFVQCSLFVDHFTSRALLSAVYAMDR